MKCPHCHIEFSATPHTFALGEDQDGTWHIATVRCPACDRIIASLCEKEGATYPVWPQASLRPQLSAEVPPEYADEYHTACRVLPHSPEASAAISRRLLHRFLAAKTYAGHGGLADQIRQVVASPDLPPYLKQGLQVLARVAKLDPASPKSQHPEALTPAEPGEAEWLLDVLESLFEFYFVQPARMKQKQAALEEMLAPPPASSADSPAEQQETGSAGTENQVAPGSTTSDEAAAT